MSGSGWNNQVVTVVIVAGTAAGKSGVYVYSPTPGEGNLIASISPGYGTDTFGNQIQEGVTVYSPSGSAIVEMLYNSALGLPVVFFANGTAEGVFYLTSAGQMVLAEAPLLAANPANEDVAETWHAVTPPSNWTASGPGIRYRMMPDNTVRFQITANISGSAASGTITLVTLPPAYRPAYQFDGCAPSVDWNGAAGALPDFEVLTTGVVQILGFPGGGGTGCDIIAGCWDIPLD